jgi:hypothetical protein
MATTPTWLEIEARVRHRVLEEGGEDFWSLEELQVAYDEGVQHQHEMAIEAAFMSGKARAAQHPYLKRFYTVTLGTLDVAEYDETVDADVYRFIDVMILDSPPYRAVWKDPGEDTYIRRYPNLQPDYGEAFWTVLGRASETPRLRIYCRGNGPQNNVSNNFERHYYRTISRTYLASPPTLYVDLPDPYNEGPVTYASAKVLAKQRTDPAPLFAEAFGIFKTVVMVPPPAPGVA